jgi:molecular chaperone GrpE
VTLGEDRNKRDEGEEHEPVVIHDKRRIDRGGASAAPAPEPAAVSVDENAKLLAERTADLQRLQAEYANYRKRAERDRLAAGEAAISRVLGDFLPVLDNLDRARAHGDLIGGLKAVADQLETIFAKLGLVAFGEVGDPFDPAIHEAVMHGESDDVEVPTCTTVMRPGYKHNGRLLRAAMVGVSDPTSPFEPQPVSEPQATSQPHAEAEDEGQGTDETNDKGEAGNRPQESGPAL